MTARDEDAHPVAFAQLTGAYWLEDEVCMWCSTLLSTRSVSATAGDHEHPDDRSGWAQWMGRIRVVIVPVAALVIASALIVAVT
ncbi:hypothetical protein [Streptomyces sp. S.PB5]|uniref:hypothetical protein n=1 Tax=Streptomyces sp. S.PB5 TaxID=3020844 RepID=UPI0025B1EDCC|nr:hypothetical protein [Streptomyces sp. S.PB5]MDN3027102.1 hypothetical protein [Streptomyces sp. S.PB5]